MRSFQNPPNPAFYVIAITWLIIFLGFDSNRSYAQFTKNDEASAVIQDMAGTKADWGDFDNDGDLDLAVVGSHGGKFAKIYRNNNGAFEDIEAELQGISGYGNAMWGDFDGDLDLDLVITGSTSVGVFPNQQDINITYIYRNDNGVFVNQEANLTGVAGWAQWCDYDRDGDLDLAVAGTPIDSEQKDVIKIYNNDQGIFTEIDLPTQPTRRYTGLSIDWGDYDKDGDDDLFVSVTGEINEELDQWHSLIFRNDEGVFSAEDISIPGLFQGHVTWGDYDADGDLDLAVMGVNYQDQDVTTIYRNDGGNFVDIESDFGDNAPGTKCASGFLDWEDYDTDGDLDLLVSGKSGGSFFTKVFRNEEGVFNDMEMPLPGAWGYAIWGDYDNDFDPDILVGGVQKVEDWYYNLTELYTNEIRTAHTIAFESIGDKTYGDADFVLTAQSSAGLEVKFEIISGQANIAGESISIYGAGEVNVRAYHSGSITHNPSYTEQLFLVEKAVLTAAATHESIIYGDAIPELGISYDGFVNGEDESDLLTIPETNTTATSASPTGNYVINLTGGASDNYDLVLIDGSLTIEKAVLTATANNESIVYGDAIPELSISYDGFVNGEDESDLLTIPGASTIATNTSPSGNYEINLTDGTSNNYDLVLIDGSLTIEKAVLTATANNESIIYGDAIPELGISYDGFVNNEDPGDLLEVPEVSTVASVGSDVGTYTIDLSGGLSNNYELILVDGVLTIEAVVLDVEKNQADVAFYPNPVRDILTITGGMECDLKLFDLHGVQHLSNAQGNSINVSVLPAGLYILHLYDAKGTTILKQKIQKLD